MISQHFTDRSRSVQYTVVDWYNDFENLFSYYGYFTAFVQTKWSQSAYHAVTKSDLWSIEAVPM